MPVPEGLGTPRLPRMRSSCSALTPTLASSATGGPRLPGRPERGGRTPAGRRSSWPGRRCPARPGLVRPASSRLAQLRARPPRPGRERSRYQHRQQFGQPQGPQVEGAQGSGQRRRQACPAGQLERRRSGRAQQIRPALEQAPQFGVGEAGQCGRVTRQRSLLRTGGWSALASPQRGEPEPSRLATSRAPVISISTPLRPGSWPFWGKINCRSPAPASTTLPHRGTCQRRVLVTARPGSGGWRVCPAYERVANRRPGPACWGRTTGDRRRWRSRSSGRGGGGDGGGAAGRRGPIEEVWGQW